MCAIAPPPGFVLAFREGVQLVEDAGGSVTLRCPAGSVTRDDLPPGVIAALRVLASVGGTARQLGCLVAEADGAAAAHRMRRSLGRWSARGLIAYHLMAGDLRLATVVPMGKGVHLFRKRIGAGARVRISRFAYCRREGDALVLESPLVAARTTLPGAIGGAAVGALARPRGYLELCASIAGLTAPAARALVNLLASLGLIDEVRDGGRLPEDEDPTLVQWAFHDLLFHSRSRIGAHDYPMGGTFPFMGRIPPLPALKPPMSDDVVRLHRPDPSRLEREDPPFVHVLERRRSIREQRDRPLTARQLGEFLYRAARVRGVIEPDSARSLYYQASRRPYPSGGGAYELEVYVTIGRVLGLPGGISHYDPLRHQLERLTGRTRAVDTLLRDAQRVAALTRPPQVLFVLTARFPRLSWKYSGIAYATTLKNVGVLYQTMYLVATAMGLAPCALGMGNSALAAEAIGVPATEEPSVGEFILGSAAVAS